MCRLLGITNFEFSRHRNIIENFCEFARTGIVMTGDPPGHEDGWGLAFYQGGQLNVHKSGVNLLQETNRVISLLSGLGNSPVMILHLRKACWADSSCTRHAHPFQFDNVAFTHKGKVYDYQGLLPAINKQGGRGRLPPGGKLTGLKRPSAKPERFLIESQ